MVEDLNPRELSWAEVDPGRHPFDPSSAAAVVASLEAARHVPTTPAFALGYRVRREWNDLVAEPWADALTIALADRLGRWVLGWRWAYGEGDVDGGPVRQWCCPPHSITGPAETLARVAAALCEWRAWLEHLADAFEAHPLLVDTAADHRDLWHRAARDVIVDVVDRTECGSAWYDHCALVLSWFLERWTVAPAVARDLVSEAVGGRFESWTAPDEEVVDEVAARLAAAVPPAHAVTKPVVPVDDLERWLTLRDRMPWKEPERGGCPEPAARPADGAVESIQAFDAVLDAARGRGMLAALQLARADAARAAPLDVELLAGWQQHVLGGARPTFRTRPAFAKRGRERYGIGPDTAARFDACLAESTAGDLPLFVRAARAYLDVCFFHPFDDGNARSAFLTLVFVLAREGVVPTDVRHLRSWSFDAGDPRDAQWCASLVHRLVERAARAVLP